MSPPRNRSNSSPLSPPQQVCRYHKYGFCKLKENCPNKHFKKICPGGCSSINACDLRHPKTCRFFRDDGFCRNENRCAYRHDNPQETLLRNYFYENTAFLHDFKQGFMEFMDDFNLSFCKMASHFLIEEFKGLLHDSRSPFTSEVPQLIHSSTEYVLIHDSEGSACFPVSSSGD